MICDGCIHARAAAEHWHPRFSHRCAKFAPDGLPSETWWQAKFEIYLTANENDGVFAYHGRRVTFNRQALLYGWLQFPDRFDPVHVLECEHKETGNG